MSQTANQKVMKYKWPLISRKIMLHLPDFNLQWTGVTSGHSSSLTMLCSGLLNKLHNSLYT